MNYVVIALIIIAMAFMVISEFKFQKSMDRSAKADERLMQTLDMLEMIASFEMDEEALETMAAVIYNTVEVSLADDALDVTPFALTRPETKKAYIKAAMTARTFVVNGLQRSVGPDSSCPTPIHRPTEGQEPC